MDDHTLAYFWLGSSLVPMLMSNRVPCVKCGSKTSFSKDSPGHQMDIKIAMSEPRVLLYNRERWLFSKYQAIALIAPKKNLLVKQNNSNWMIRRTRPLVDEASEYICFHSPSSPPSHLRSPLWLLVAPSTADPLFSASYLIHRSSTLFVFFLGQATGVLNPQRSAAE